VTNEPDITINGVRLSVGQAMALRVAATSYHVEMSQPNALGDDEVGVGIAKGYRERLSEVLDLMILHAAAAERADTREGVIK
jgi:hypothetical protein